MKKLFVISIVTALMSFSGYSQILKRIGDKIKNQVEQPVDKDKIKEQNGNQNTEPATTKDTTREEPGSVPTAEPQTFKTYSNYDFVPGTKILFEDNFADDQDGEFPAHWELRAGQAILNKVGGFESFCLTDGNYARVFPRMKTEKYLSDSFTIEYDYYYVPGSYHVELMLKGFDKDLGFERESNFSIGNNEAGFTGTWGGVSLSKSYPEDLVQQFENKWHHVAVAVKNGQAKVYVDQYRVLVVPDMKEKYDAIEFAGIGAEKEPIVFRNVRIASGSGMNMLGKKFTDSKIVTHGINFDVNKASIKPESMGTLNMIVQVMKDNPEIKFEVGGHTDADGSDDYNLKLSQQRADAVKEQLIKMGIDASRLTAKGFGESKPISDNTSLEGKANNRRVEFVKQ